MKAGTPDLRFALKLGAPSNGYCLNTTSSGYSLLKGRGSITQDRIDTLNQCLEKHELPNMVTRGTEATTPLHFRAELSINTSAGITVVRPSALADL